MTNLSLPSDAVVEEEKDILGGNRLLESGLYEGTIEMMYLDSHESGTKFIMTHFKKGNRVYKISTNISTRPKNPDDKESVSFTYTDKKTKEQKPLPGYSLMDSLLKSITNQGIAEQTLESKKLKVYNRKERKELPKDVQVFTSALNKKARVGIIKLSKEGTTKESGYKQGTGEFYESNEFDKFFDPETGQTMSEKAAGKDAAFLLKWKEKNDNKTRVQKAPQSAANTGAKSGTPNNSADVEDPFK